MLDLAKISMNAFGVIMQATRKRRSTQFHGLCFTANIFRPVKKQPERNAIIRQDEVEMNSID